MHTIALIVDNPKRDLPGCVLLAQQLKRKKISSVLIPMSLSNLVLFRFEFDYVLLNYLRPNNKQLFSDLIATGHAVGVLDTEGGVFTKVPPTNDLDYFHNLIDDHNLRHQVKHYFFWGKELFAACQNKNTFQARQMFLTGTPRSDFYHPSFKKFYDLTDKKYLLVNASFSMINPKFSTPEKELKMMTEVFGFDEAYLKTVCDQQKLAQKKIIESTKHLASEFANLKIIFRPHPFEDERYYLEYFSEFTNILVKNTGTVDEWLAQSIGLIHFESSTSLEAACFHIPAFSPFGFKSLRPIHWAEEVTDYYQSDSELSLWIGQILNGEYIIQKQSSQAIENVFYKIDGHSAVRIAEQIASLVVIGNKKLFVKYLYNLKYAARKIIKLILRKKLIPESKKLNSISVHELNQRISRVTGIQCKIDQITESVFKVY